MSTDLRFEKKAALEAGMEMTHMEVEERMHECIRVPGMDLWSQSICFDDKCFSVRASKWGPDYIPFTNFLRENGIPWEEW